MNMKSLLETSNNINSSWKILMTIFPKPLVQVTLMQGVTHASRRKFLSRWHGFWQVDSRNLSQRRKARRGAFHASAGRKLWHVKFHPGALSMQLFESENWMRYAISMTVAHIVELMHIIIPPMVEREPLTCTIEEVYSSDATQRDVSARTPAPVGKQKAGYWRVDNWLDGSVSQVILNNSDIWIGKQRNYMLDVFFGLSRN